MSDRHKKIPGYFSEREFEGGLAVLSDLNLTQFEGPNPQGQAQQLLRAIWFEEAKRDLEELCSFRPNWNSYRGVAPSQYFAQRMAEVLELVACEFEAAESPKVFATPTGGIALEWSSSVGDFDIKVKPGDPPFATLRLGDAEPEFLAFDWDDPMPMQALARRYFT